MKSALNQLASYAAYHRDRRNIATHAVGLPLIAFAVIALLSRVGIEFSVGGMPITLTPAIPAVAAAAIYYLLLDLELGAVLTAIMIVMARYGAQIAALRALRGRCGPSAIEVVLQDRVDGTGGNAHRSRRPAQAASSRSRPYVLASRRMPTQARKPCSGCVRLRRMISTSAEAWRPIAPACRRCARRPVGIAPVARWHVLAHQVVCLRLDDERTCAATRLPRWNTSIVRAVMRAQTGRAATGAAPSSSAFQSRRDDRARPGIPSIRRRRRARPAAP